MARSEALRAAAPPDRLLPAITGRSVAVFAAAVVVLLGPWPGYGRVFRVLFAAYANGVLAASGAGGAAEPAFRWTQPEGADPGGGPSPWTVWVGATRGARAAEPPAPLDTRILGYTPLALLLALVVASPDPWRRRAALLGVGGALLLARVGAAIGLAVGDAFGTRTPGPASELVWYVAIDLPAMTYVAPLAAWAVALALTERRSRRRVSPNRR
jgi:hypothetical protein